MPISSKNFSLQLKFDANYVSPLFKLEENDIWKFWSWHESCLFEPCAKSCDNRTSMDQITTKRIFHRALTPFTCVNFKHKFDTSILSIQVHITLDSTLEDLADGKPALVEVMVWCRQAASHYLDQCYPRSAMPYEGHSEVINCENV